MANDDMKNEIEELRAQVAELTADRKARQKEQASSSQESVKESAAQDTATSEPDTDETGEIDLSSQFQELIDTIDQELKEASPVTVLVVFALGVLVGRLLPR